MSKMTRKKHGWPVALMLALGIVGVLAAFVALTASPGAAQAQAGCDGPFASLLPACAGATPTPAPTAGPGETPAPTMPPEPTEPPAPTMPPEPTEPPGGTPDPNRPTLAGSIDDVELEADQVRLVITDLSTYFSVEAEDADLEYEAESDNEAVATVSIDGSTLTVTRVRDFNARGMAEISVWASNGNLRSEEPQTFTVTVEGLSVSARHSIDYRGLLLAPHVAVTSGIGPDDDFRYGVEFEGDQVNYEHVAIQSVLTDWEEFRFAVKIVDWNGEQLGEDATVNVSMKPSRENLLGGTIGLDSPARPRADLIGLLTVRSTDEDSERTFGVEFKCERVGDRLDIDIHDEDLRLVLEAAIVCVSPEVTTVSQPDCYQIVADSDAMYGTRDRYVMTELPRYGLRDREGVRYQLRERQSVRDQWWDDERDDNFLRTSTDGRYTIQVPASDPHLQLTVTACEEGPVYIRFLDSDGNPFGTDLDEIEAEAGADIVGLDSQGKLELNLGGNLGPGPNYGPQTPVLTSPEWAPSHDLCPQGPDQAGCGADWAHWYDHFTVIRTTDAEGEVSERLTGRPGTYYQGKFRFFNACPTPDNHFYVEVYEKRGKEFRTQERINCVVDPVQPTNLSVTTYDDRPGVALLRWRPVPNADTHLVVVIDTASRAMVPVTATPDHEGTTITGLVNGKQYAFAVLAQRGQGSRATYNTAVIYQTMSWSSN